MAECCRADPPGVERRQFLSPSSRGKTRRLAWRERARNVLSQGRCRARNIGAPPPAEARRASALARGRPAPPPRADLRAGPRRANGGSDSHLSVKPTGRIDHRPFRLYGGRSPLLPSPGEGSLPPALGPFLAFPIRGHLLSSILVWLFLFFFLSVPPAVGLKLQVNTAAL